MKKIISKTNLSLLIIALCAILFCGLFAISNIKAKKMPTAHAESSATLKGYVSSKSDIWWNLIDYEIENLIITNNFDTNNAGASIDVSDGQDGALYAYKIDNGDGTYNCVIYADVEKIYAPQNSSFLFAGMLIDSSSATTILHNIKSISFQNNCFNTSNVTDMSSMFGGCSNLLTVDVSSFDTSQVTNMYSMFALCSNLQEIDVINFDTRKVVDMSAMFAGCKSLKSLELNNFNTENVEKMFQMFNYCESLTSINVSSFDTKNVTSMNLMFAGCKNLIEIDVSNFNTSKVSYICMMFGNCQKLEKVDMSSFDLSAVHADDMHYALFGVSQSVMKSQFGMPEDASVEDIEAVIEQQFGGYTEEHLFKGMIGSLNLKQIKLPRTLGTAKIFLPIENELYVDGNENMPLNTIANDSYGELYEITSDYDGKIIKSLNVNTPSTGFVDEQLLPAVAIGVVSVLAVVVIGTNKKRRFNI